MSMPGMDRIGPTGPKRMADGGCKREIRLPGPVPIEDSGGHAWPTWREALLDAFAGVERAYERRRQVVQAAYDAGLSLRQIAEAVGVSAAGVHRMIGHQRAKSADELLDSPAFEGKRP